MDLSETQWVAVVFVLAIAIISVITGYLWQKDESKKTGGPSMVPLQTLYPTPTKNQEWSYGHAFLPVEEAPPHDPGHSVVSGAPLNAEYCRWGANPTAIIDGENDLWWHNIYTVQPSMYNLKYYKQSL